MSSEPQKAFPALIILWRLQYRTDGVPKSARLSHHSMQVFRKTTRVHIIKQNRPRLSYHYIFVFLRKTSRILIFKENSLMLSNQCCHIFLFRKISVLIFKENNPKLAHQNMFVFQKTTRVFIFKDNSPTLFPHNIFLFRRKKTRIVLIILTRSSPSYLRI